MRGNHKSIKKNLLVQKEIWWKKIIGIWIDLQARNYKAHFSVQGSPQKEVERTCIISGTEKIGLFIVLTWAILGRSQGRKYVALFIHVTGEVRMEEH